MSNHNCLICGLKLEHAPNCPNNPMGLQHGYDVRPHTTNYSWTKPKTK